MDLLLEVMLDNKSRVHVLAEDTLALQKGDFCIFKKNFFLDSGNVFRIIGDYSENKNYTPFLREKVGDLPRVIRKGTVVDQGKVTENAARTRSALEMASACVAKLNLDMKLINAHYSYDGKVLLIQFSAEGRVDFRELVKQLAEQLQVRIDLYQIGVRDEASILGGLAPCGRLLCCSQFLRDFESINVKMAKEQNLMPTPSSISGVCGRLKCCLKYEYEGYKELEKTMPRHNDVCDTAEGRGRVIDRNLLTQKVTVELDESHRTIICPASEVRVVYLDKYKKDFSKISKNNEQKK